MLIDGKNAVYRAVFAGYHDKRFRESGYDYFVILMRFIANYITIFNPQSVHIFWDAPRKSTWRKAENNQYKEHRKDKYKDLDIDINKELNKHIRTAIKIFKLLNCRQYYKSNMEADDLIYSFCLVNQDSDVLIVSSDGDMHQIPYTMNNVRIYNPLKKTNKIEPVSKVDITIVKALSGDASDNIKGYYNIGPVKSKKMASNPRLLYEFLLSPKAVVKNDDGKVLVGDKLYLENKSIIDLSMCPYLTENCGYVMDKQKEQIQFDVSSVKSIILNNKIVGLVGSIDKYCHAFKNLI